VSRVIKSIRGREYYYDQTSQRIGGKVKTKSRYVGPVNPKRKKSNVGFMIGGLLALGVSAAKGELKTHKGRAGLPDKRTMVYEHERRMELALRDPKAAIAEMQSRAARSRSSARLVMNDEKRELLDLVHAFDAKHGTHRAERAQDKAHSSQSQTPASDTSRSSPAATSAAPAPEQPGEQSPTGAPGTDGKP